MKLVLAIGIISTLYSCYSFKGISIPPDIKTFQVETFSVRAINAPANIEVQFSEALRNKILVESRLKQDNNNPDIVFSGELNRYDISAEAPKEGNIVALNKLEISVKVDYQNNKDEKDKWSKTFSFFQTYDSSLDLQLVENQLIRVIFEQLTERIFNDAFTKW